MAEPGLAHSSPLLCQQEGDVQAGIAMHCTPGGHGTPRKMGPQGPSQVSHIL